MKKPPAYMKGGAAPMQPYPVGERENRVYIKQPKTDISAPGCKCP